MIIERSMLINTIIAMVMMNMKNVMIILIIMIMAYTNSTASVSLKKG